MLNLIPKELETLNRGEKYILNKLQNLYKTRNYDAYLYLEPKIRNLFPDFILVDPFYGVAIIEVKNYTIDDIKKMDNKTITLFKNQTTHNPAHRARQYYNTLRSLFSFKDELLNEKGELNFSLNSFVFFNQISKEEMEPFQNFLSHYPAKILYKEDIKKLKVEDIFDKPTLIAPYKLDLIRVSISPEITIFKENDITALDKSQEEFAKRVPKGHYHISGVPGSGKTVVLITRAIYLKKLNPHWNILILTYNKSLASKIKNTLENLEVEFELDDIKITDIEVTNFHKFIKKYSNINFKDYTLDETFWRETLVNSALPNISPEYDAILIDEYQDFYEDWIRACIKAIIPHEGNKNILLAGDRLQSIYNPNEINFKKSFNLDMRGRSKLLKKTYRSFKEGLELGLKILSEDEKYKKEIEKFYEGINDIESINSKGNIAYFSTYSEIIDFLEKNREEEMLILAPDWKTAHTFYDTLPYSLKKEFKVRKEVQNDYFTITTYHSSKGLEAPLVVLLEFDKIEDAKLKYVALTRSYKTLIIHNEKNII